MKKVIAIESMPIIESDDVDIRALVELAIAMPDMVVAAGAIDMAMSDIVLVGDIDVDMEPAGFIIDISMACWLAVLR